MRVSAEVAHRTPIGLKIVGGERRKHKASQNYKNLHPNESNKFKSEKVTFAKFHQQQQAVNVCEPNRIHSIDHQSDDAVYFPASIHLSQMKMAAAVSYPSTKSDENGCSS